MPEVYQETALYGGHVQGVGFRVSTLEVAREFEVAGYVQNLPDGRVQVEVEGRKSDVLEFLKILEEKMHGYIRKTERAGRMGPSRHGGFVIR